MKWSGMMWLVVAGDGAAKCWCRARGQVLPADLLLFP
jgi:hypothetical protein